LKDTGKTVLHHLPLTIDIEKKAIFRMTVVARSALAELNGVVTGIPNLIILLETLALSEARESSAIENIISIFADVYQLKT
jgi:Fic family protein